MKEDSLIPTKWPLTEVNVGKDGLVRVITVKTDMGTYKRPITKITLLLPTDRIFVFWLVNPPFCYILKSVINSVLLF